MGITIKKQYIRIYESSFPVSNMLWLKLVRNMQHFVSLLSPNQHFPKSSNACTVVRQSASAFHSSDSTYEALNLF